MARMRTPKKPSKLTQKKEKDQYEVRLQEASKAYTKKKFKNLACTALHYGVKYHTLRRRHLKIHGPQSQSQPGRQLLSNAQEMVLSEWIKYLGMIGYPLSKQMLCAKVANISQVIQERMKELGKKLLPGKTWVYSFLEQHPEVKLKWPSGCYEHRTLEERFSVT